MIESKWDNLANSKNEKITLRKEQKVRHQIFSWYLTHWDEKYSKNWENFEKEQKDYFQKDFEGRRLAPTDSITATNLEFTLSMILKHFGKAPSELSIKNILLFFYNKKHSVPPTKIPNGFILVAIDYSKEITGNFIYLENLAG